LQLKPEPKIKLKTSGIALTKDTDYLLDYGENKNAGTAAGTITIIGIDAYYGLEKTISFDIIPKTITLKSAAAQNKEYDGTTAAAISGTLGTGVLGVATGDDVSIGNGVFASKDAGTGIAVSNVAITGTSAANYKLEQPAGLTANITQKPLIITLNPKIVNIAQSDPMTKVTEKIAYNGLASGETSSLLSGVTGIYKDGLPLNSTPAAGEYNITLSGTRTAANYTYTYDNEGLQLIVTADPVTPSSSSIAITPSSSSAVATPSSSSETATPSSSSTVIPSSSSITITLSSSSITITLSSSSITITPSSSSWAATPVIQPQRASGNIRIHTTANAIVLENLPKNAKVEVYNLQGKQVYSAYPENPLILRIGVQTKGVYVIKASNQTMRVVVR
jgi:hypothetical protein